MRGFVLGLSLGLAGCGAGQLEAAGPNGLPWYAHILTRCDGGDLKACIELSREYQTFGSDKENAVPRHAAEMACFLKDAASCRWFSVIVPDPARRSPPYLWRACYLGSDDACDDLARGYTLGLDSKGLPRDPVRAVEATEHRCRLGDTSSCWHVVRALWEGTCALGVGADCSVVQRDPERADLNLGRVSCQGKDAATCATTVGLLHAGTPCSARAARASRAETLDCYPTGINWDTQFLFDPERAFGLVATGCEGGVALACFAQAKMLYEGAGVTADRARAVTLLERTCEGGSVESCFLLGRIHLAMREVPAAVEAFTRAAGDDAEIRREAGLRLVHKKKLAEAEPFLAAACSAGDRPACAAEGRLLVISGKRIDVAIPLLQRACEEDGLLKPCRALSHVYAKKGQGVLAKKYFALGQPGDAGAPYRDALKRAFTKGDAVGQAAFWATVACPPLLVLALPTPVEHGYGFDDLSYRDP